MKTPEFLFHYSSINSLALILANKTFRFTAINNVNDINEGKTQDMENLGMYMFTSCWTDYEEEYLPLWNMYTQDMRGVRIKLPFPIFPTYEYKKNMKSFVPKDKWIGKNFMIMPQLEPIRKVIYTDDPELLYPKTIVDMGNGFEGLDFKQIGRYKSTLWQFEQEWRFYLYILPKPNSVKKNDSSFPLDQLTKLIDNRESVPFGFSHYDLLTDPYCFSKMEITLGPKIQPGDKEIVESLISKFNPTSKLLKSDLTGKIR